MKVRPVRSPPTGSPSFSSQVYARFGALDEDGPRAVTHEPLEHFSEAGTVGDRVRFTHRRVVERVDDLVACGLGVGLDGGALALVAVLVHADVCAA